ncbi:hypothetical protein BJ508DRAFT_17270 [Ascobolus immersus RN42]|uniref:Uncharacterized protein n=1 Tax=Ascobolus immersus RN42 TaxID=1160509 RepID=A0A3N4HPB5_ASCIM|nr:hypothetical protein BJ508DRAFT_17270 [Ascobolus immersus RN42]
MKPTNTQADPDDLWQITDFQLNALRYLKPHRIVCLLRVRPRCTGSTNLPSVPAFPYDVFRKDYNHPHDLKDLRSRIQGALYYYSNVTAGVDKFCGSRIVGFYRNGKAYAIGKHVQLIDDLTEEGVLGGQSSAVPEFIVLHRKHP